MAVAGYSRQSSVLVQGDIQDVDYRPPYESTEQLLKKGLIKQITYTRKISSIPNADQGVSAEAKPDDRSELARQEAAAAAPAVETESAVSAEEPQAEGAVPEEIPMAADDENASAESAAEADSGNKTQKKTSRSKNHVTKK